MKLVKYIGVDLHKTNFVVCLLNEDETYSLETFPLSKATSPLIDFYQRKKREKGSGKAICATARKLLAIIFVMLKKELDYWYLEERLYNRKLRLLSAV